MGVIEDISKLPVWQKCFVTTIIILIPFWFLIISFFYPEMKDYDLEKLVLYVLPPSIIYYLLNIGWSFMLFMLLDEQDETTQWISLSITAIIELAILMLIGYFWIETITTFLLVALGLQVWRILVFAFVHFMASRKHKK